MSQSSVLQEHLAGVMEQMCRTTLNRLLTQYTQATWHRLHILNRTRPYNRAVSRRLNEMRLQLANSLVSNCGRARQGNRNRKRFYSPMFNFEVLSRFFWQPPSSLPSHHNPSDILLSLKATQAHDTYLQCSIRITTDLMERPHSEVHSFRQLAYPEVSPQALLIYTFAALFLVQQVLHHYNKRFSTIGDTLIGALVTILPARLLLEASEPQTDTWSQTHAAKADAMRRMLGLYNNRTISPVNLLQRIRAASTLPDAGPITTNAPPGLGNWDNSCYQNSVLQGLTSLQALRTHLTAWHSKVEEDSTMSAMQEIVEKLRSPYQNGKQLWTPARLKNMSSLQQQDAQEYYSKVVDEMDKDIARIQKPTRPLDGCEIINKQNIAEARSTERTSVTNPLEGMLAQQVICTSCGFSEGLSLIPFNCLTLPLENKAEVTLEECLSEYTKLEPITGVECAKCTLLKTRKELERLAQPADKEDAQFKKMLQLPSELRAQVMQRLTAVQSALDIDDFSDETLNKACQIPKNVRVSSTKTRQALLARLPANLVIHINRSVFDEMTGMLRKNIANVSWPASLDLGPWILGNGSVDGAHLTQVGLPREDLWKYVYRIKAIVTHYGRHENGHYIAYRQAPLYAEDEILPEDIDLSDDRKQQWWRLSDETVSSMSEEDVLDQGGVFMLFYERVNEPDLIEEIPTEPLEALSVREPILAERPLQMEHINAEPGTSTIIPLQVDGKVVPPAPRSDIAASEASFTEDESEADLEEPVDMIRKPSPPSPLLMRTATAALPNEEIWNVGRFVAAS